MSVAEQLRRFREDFGRRATRRGETLDAVYDDDLWPLLSGLGLLSKLDAGELECAVTGELLSRETVGGILITPGGPRLVSQTAAIDSALAGAAR